MHIHLGKYVPIIKPTPILMQLSRNGSRASASSILIKHDVSSTERQVESKKIGKSSPPIRCGL